MNWNSQLKPAVKLLMTNGITETAAAEIITAAAVSVGVRVQFSG